MYYLQPSELVHYSKIAFSYENAFGNNDALTELERNERNLDIAKHTVKLCRATCQAWAKQALVDMLRKSVESGADYVSALARALDETIDGKKYVFPETRKAYRALMPAMDGAFVESRDSKGRLVIEFVATRKTVFDIATARILALAIEQAEVVKFDKEFLSNWKQGASRIIFAGKAEVKLVNSETLTAAKTAKAKQAEIAKTAQKELENAAETGNTAQTTSRRNRKTA